ncbi:MAG: hypothetical protein JRI68_23485, partial [Deltaproteobacteria bacterium]|nr:hypothetical protein [Deltaproteobacteria bacterium]
MSSAVLLVAFAATPVVLAQPVEPDPATPDVEVGQDAPDEPVGEEGGPAEAGDDPAADELVDLPVDPGALPADGAPAAAAPAPGPAPPPAPPGGALSQDTRYRVMRPEQPDQPEPEVPTGPYVPHWMSAEIGVRNWVVFDEGIEPYSATGFVAQGAFTLNFVPFHFGDFAIGLSAEYDLGQTSHHVRTIDSSVTLHRIGAGIHAQYLLSRLRFFARVIPAAWHVQGSLEDDAFERPLKANGWTWGVDATGGVAVRIGSAGGPPNDRHVRFWLLAELGYGFAGAVDMSYGPEEDDEDPRVYGSVDLPPVRPSG